LGRNASLLQEAQQEISRFESAPQEAEQVDNYERLNRRFQEQKTTRSRGVVKGLAPNWKEIEEKKEDQPQGEKQLKFNLNFLDKNKLANPAEEAEGEKAGKKAQPAAKGGALYYEPQKPGAQPPAKQPVAPQVALGKLKAQLDESRGEQTVASTLSRRQSNRELDRDAVGRYQQKLDVQQSAQQGQQGRVQLGVGVQSEAGLEGRVVKSESRAEPANEQAVATALAWLQARESANGSWDFDKRRGRAAGRAGGGEDDQRRGPGGTLAPHSLLEDVYGEVDIQNQAIAGGVGGAGAVPAADTGLASLRLQLPDRSDMYEVYRFTTPLGDVQVTARAASSGAIRRLIELGILLAVLLVAAYAVRLVRRGRFRWLGGKSATTVLICLGLLGFAFGILPVAALTVAIVAVAVKIRHRVGQAPRA